MMTVEVKEVFHIPGRLRLSISPLYNNEYIEKLLNTSFPKRVGISNITARSATGNITICYDKDKIDKEYIKKLIREFNYNKEIDISKKTDNSVVFDPQELPISKQVFNVVIGGVVIGWALVQRFLLGNANAFMGGALLSTNTIATLITGIPIFKSGLDYLIKEKKFNNDFLIASATVASLLLGEGVTALVVVWLVNLSTLFETITIGKSRKAIREILAGKGHKAWLVVKGMEISVDIDTLQKGDMIAVHIGERIPVDGIVEEGSILVNQAPITGESVPVMKEKGDYVFGGTIVEEGTARVIAEKVGEDTSINRIIKMVEEASNVRAPIQNIAEVYSRKIVPLSFALSLGVYLFTGDFIRSVTMLIVACPCAAGIATPTAISASMGNCAKRGILIKGGAYLEGAGNIDTLLFDKTGTLTEGRPKVTSILPTSDYEINQLVAIAAACETGNRHPIATAIIEKADEIRVTPLMAEQHKVTIGKGVECFINNKKYRIGNRSFANIHGVDIEPMVQEAETLKNLGETVLFISEGKKLLGLIGLQDTIRKESYRAIKSLRELGIKRIGLITGDNSTVGNRVKEALGLDFVISEAMPEDKLQIVEQEQLRGHKVAMVGDGINDSPAMAKADLGIAMGAGGTDVAIECADIVLAGDDLQKIGELITISKNTLRVIKQSYAFAIGVNAIGIGLGAVRMISPLIGAILHNASTLGVVMNSATLLYYDPEPKNNDSQNYVNEYRYSTIEAATSIEQVDER